MDVATGPLGQESRDLAWSLGPTTVDGTLTLPAGVARAAVVMVAGSGPTDRNWNSPLLPGTNGSARLLAEALARSGFASIRYDKRGVGPHAADNLRVLQGTVSMETHRQEVESAVRVLARQDGVRADRIFALTNSEGALHALNYQRAVPQVPLAGLILTAPPGRPVAAVVRTQLAAQAAAVPNGDTLLAAYDAAVRRFVAGEPAAPDPALPEGVRMLLRSLEAPLNLPFARELWVADAAALVQRMRAPLLVIIGRRDIQVDWRLDGEPLQRAAADHPDATFLFPPHANHVLKHDPGEGPLPPAAEAAARYNAPEARLDPDVEAAIVGWLAGHS